MTSIKLWLQVSISFNLAKKKKIKILLKDDDYEQAFLSLKEACRNMLQQYLKPSGEIPEIEMVYKAETDLDGDDVNLDEADDLEGMLDDYPLGKGVRVIINTEGMHNASNFNLSGKFEFLVYIRCLNVDIFLIFALWS
jgi:hypothetical protein